MLVLVACLAAVPLSDAHASLGNAGRQDGALLPTAPATAESRDDAVDKPAKPRRSRMAEVTPEDRPAMRFSAMYRMVERSKPSKDNCLKGTGSRLKREGANACAGYGQAYVPDR
jgi:hypothetical protein